MLIQQGFGGLSGGLRRLATLDPAKTELFHHRGKQNLVIRVLEDKADLVRQACYPARLGLQKPFDEPKQRTLSRAIRADQADSGLCEPKR